MLLRKNSSKTTQENFHINLELIGQGKVPVGVFPHGQKNTVVEPDGLPARHPRVIILMDGQTNIILERVNRTHLLK